MARLSDPVGEFFLALNDADVDRLTRCLHPDFEMVVPQKPARGFKGRDQEVQNMKTLLDAHPDLSVTVLRRADSRDEVWTETLATADGLEMAAVIIWTVDDATGTLTRGRYYSEVVQRDAPLIGEWIRSLGAPGEEVNPSTRPPD
jgi:ketosteroid isomerase-like protein